MQVTPPERPETRTAANGPVSGLENNLVDALRGVVSQFQTSMDDSSLQPPSGNVTQTEAPDASGAPMGASNDTECVPPPEPMKESKEDQLVDVNTVETKVENSTPIGSNNGEESTPGSEQPVGAGASQPGGVEPVPGPSGTQSVSEDFRNILGDIDIPEGVDPSFLAALPEDMRQEVIAEHLRLQTLRSRPPAVAGAAAVVAAAAGPAEPAASVVDVSPEFLAALPPNIQEEVLAQQRIEQQRRMATVSNPNDPMDTEAFFRNLQPSLRQAILADMEESQIAALPADLAAEAQSLRREWETRNRQFLQDRLFSHGHSGTTLSSILRGSGE